MSQRLAHRGPDAAGIQCFESLQLGIAHRRLSIIDLSTAANQPMVFQDRYWLTFNGEIYNYLELRDELSLLGANFQTQSDAEVLLQAYHYWGPDCVHRFNGMFAFALLDLQTRMLYCARDPYGVKPFYYLNNASHFGFASEIKALLQVPSYQKCANRKAIRHFLVDAKIEQEAEGFFKAIFELLPGHTLAYQIDQQTIRIQRYYKPDKIDANLAAEKVPEALQKALRLRLRADVPIGLCLSGGLDSSSLLHLAKQAVQHEHIDGLENGLHCFTAIHESESCERRWAEQMIDASHATWHPTQLHSSNLIDALPDLIYHQDIPLVSSSTFAQSSVMKSAAAAGIKILIDGQGGDELFAGYQVFYATYLKELFWKFQWVKCFREWRNLEHSPTSKRFLITEWIKDLVSYLPKALQFQLYKRSKASYHYLRKAHVAERKRQHSLQAHLEWYCSAYELKGLLRWEDRCSMQYSIESRTPFADDLELMQVARSLKPEALIFEGWSKFALRKALDQQLPSAISWRRDKKGFSVPQTQWMLESSSFWQDLLITKANLDQSELIDQEKLLAQLPRIFASDTFAEELDFVFRYGCYLLWLERFEIRNFDAS
jgi:asparagine synthase (glutamine-hydrolysing)